MEKLQNYRETPLTSQQENFQIAVKAVCLLYTNDIVGQVTGYPPPEQRDSDWKVIATKLCVQHSEIIIKLKTALKTAYTLKETNPELNVDDLISDFPIKKGEKLAQLLLDYLLLYCTMLSKPNDFKEEAKKEAEKMLKELEVKGLYPKKTKRVLTLHYVVESVLKNNLKI